MHPVVGLVGLDIDVLLKKHRFKEQGKIIVINHTDYLRLKLSGASPLFVFYVLGVSHGFR
jgi:hypothetical protein